MVSPKCSCFAGPSVPQKATKYILIMSRDYVKRIQALEGNFEIISRKFSIRWVCYGMIYLKRVVDCAKTSIPRRNAR